LGPAAYLTANIFFLRVHDPISYANPAPGVNGYYNFDHTGSQGLELSLRTLGRNLVSTSTLALSRADDHNADFYRVAGQPDFHVGFANLKFTHQAQWTLAPGWSLNPELLVLGPRYGYRLGAPQPSRFGTTALLNLFLTHRFSNQAELGLSVRNLGNTATSYIQAYGVPGMGGNPPLPGPGRELALRASFAF
jgi:outer membrane cobalamin receptor